MSSWAPGEDERASAATCVGPVSSTTSPTNTARGPAGPTDPSAWSKTRQVVPRPRARATSQPPVIHTDRSTVVVIAEQNLIGEAVRMALQSRGFEALSLHWPRAPRQLNETRRRVAVTLPQAGLLYVDLDNQARVREARALVRAVPLKWLVLVGDPASSHRGAMVSVGVRGIADMSTSLEALTYTLGQLIAGKQIMHPATRDQLVREWRDRETRQRLMTSRLSTLTPRERQVLEALYDGLAVKTISGLLGVAEGTVRTQVKSVLRKLGVNSQLEAVAALRQVREQTDLDAQLVDRQADEGRGRG